VMISFVHRDQNGSSQGDHVNRDLHISAVYSVNNRIIFDNFTGDAPAISKSIDNLPDHETSCPILKHQRRHCMMG
jgi:hypothetical protein